MVEAPVLEHCNPTKPLTLVTDALPYKIGAILSHVMEDGSKQPVTFISHTLKDIEKRYSQLSKELGPSHHFWDQVTSLLLYGRQFSIVSDHKPLQYLLNESHAVLTMASVRLQCWALLLSAYQYTILYQRRQKLANADGLSRLPLPDTPNASNDPS